jgi:3-dehydroquinate dehydratase/shikimate dehydrogenase
MSFVCLALTAPTIAENLALLDRYRDKIDIAELRVDHLDPADYFTVRSFPERARLPCILTVRRKVDGGQFEGGEGVRLVVMAKALAYARRDKSCNFAYVDLESDFRVPAVEEACRTFGTRIIRSSHFACDMPRDLDAEWAELCSEPDEIPKITVALQGATDLAKLVSWIDSLHSGPRVVIATGDFGMPTRILSERLGSMICYTSALSAGMPGAAPGHLDPETLTKVFRIREIGRDTAIYALGGGRSVVASKSPGLHNEAFRAAGIDAVYTPIAAESAGAFLAAAEAIGIRGAAITVPLKEDILPYLAYRSPEVEDIGACNTLVRNPEGWAGYNTDTGGFERSLLEFLQRKDLHGLRSTIVGAGGAAKAVASVLARLGAAVLVLNRSTQKARELARRYGFAWAPCDDRAVELVADHSDLIVQATPIGMEGYQQGNPLFWYDLTGREAVFDCIYRPERTALLAKAEEAGCRTINGWPMLRYQAAEQFRLWTGREPPLHYFE